MAARKFTHSPVALFNRAVIGQRLRMPATPKKISPPRSASLSPKTEGKPQPVVQQYLVRCTFLGENKKQKIEGAFRFFLEATDTSRLAALLEKAVKRLHRTGELPRRCDVYVEYVLELADLRRGVVVDFERWEREPRKFQHGCIAFSDTCRHHEAGFAGLQYHFGKPAEAPAPTVPPIPAAS